MTLRCFIAMAFGRDDTDKLYDHLIVPTLRDKDVTPVRVDRIEHNDDIDDRIIYELERCDLVLADLTYARPSVYFEAGFGQRQVPVIYTCRRDHLAPKADDPLGNFRVHFDLQMKNIIPWSSPFDAQFAPRLARRMTRVIAPLLRAKETEQARRKEAERFAALSLQDKTQHLLEISIRVLTKDRYRGTRLEDETQRRLLDVSPPTSPIDQLLYELGQHPKLRLLTARLQLKPGWLGTKLGDGVIKTAMIHVTPNLTKSKLAHFRDGVLKYPIYDLNPALKPGTVQSLLEYLFICTFRKVPPSRVLDALDDFQRGQQRNVFVRASVQMVPPEGAVARHAKIYTDPNGEGFIVLNARLKDAPSRSAIYRLKSGELIHPDGYMLGQVREASRWICICVLDDVESEEAFATGFSDLYSTIEAQLEWHRIGHPDGSP